jgi:tetratricopeptide (TPR) repeat protein
MADVEMLAGEFETADAILCKADAYLRERNETGVRSTVVGARAHAKYVLGEFGDALALSEESERLTDEEDFQSQTLWRGARAKALAALDHGDDAVTFARSAVAAAHHTDWLNLQGDALMDLGDVLLRDDSRDEARGAFEDAEDRYERKGNLISARTAERAMAHVDS